MEEGLKKRLVGAAVLASLVVIFVPMLIDEPGVTPPELSQIPPPPARKDFTSEMLTEEVVRPEPVRVDISREKEPAPESAKPAATAPKSKPKAKPRPQAGLTAWMVKVGSFSHRNNAEKLVAKLRKAGYQTPDAERVELRGKTLYRVRVGPMVQKEKAQSLLPKINRISGTKGQVVRFQ